VAETTVSIDDNIWYPSVSALNHLGTIFTYVQYINNTRANDSLSAQVPLGLLDRRRSHRSRCKASLFRRRADTARRSL
jgi:hypothetical protein